MEIPTLKELKEKASEDKKPSTAQANIEKPKLIECKSKKSLPGNGGYGTGKRKNSVARVWVKPGNGKITINNKDIIEYFPRESYRNAIKKPFILTNTLAQYDVHCTAMGGGTTGQSGAIAHGISRALDCISDDFHTVLRQSGLLTRDPRVVERKKPGKPKARKSSQFSKR